MKRIGAVLVVICATAGAADTPTLTPEQMREDLIHLRDVWAPLDKSFSEEERAAFVTIVNDAISRVNTLTPTDFSLEIARAVAVSRNGHTESSLGPWFHGLPFKAAWFTDGMYIVRVDPRFPQLLGARIERFGAFTPEQAVTRLAPYVAGTDEWIHYLSPAYLRFAEVLHRIGAAATATKVSLTVRRRDGKKETTVLTQDAWSTDPDPGDPWLALVPTDKEVPGRWLQVLDDVSARPLMYQRPTDVSWH